MVLRLWNLRSRSIRLLVYGIVAMGVVLNAALWLSWQRYYYWEGSTATMIATRTPNNDKRGTTTATTTNSRTALFGRLMAHFLRLPSPMEYVDALGVIRTKAHVFSDDDMDDTEPFRCRERGTHDSRSNGDDGRRLSGSPPWSVVHRVCLLDGGEMPTESLLHDTPEYVRSVGRPCVDNGTALRHAKGTTLLVAFPSFSQRGSAKEDSHWEETWLTALNLLYLLMNPTEVAMEIRQRRTSPTVFDNLAIVGSEKLRNLLGDLRHNAPQDNSDNIVGFSEESDIWIDLLEMILRHNRENFGSFIFLSGNMSTPAAICFDELVVAAAPMTQLSNDYNADLLRLAGLRLRELLVRSAGVSLSSWNRDQPKKMNARGTVILLEDEGRRIGNVQEMTSFLESQLRMNLVDIDMEDVPDDLANSRDRIRREIFQAVSGADILVVTSLDALMYSLSLAPGSIVLFVSPLSTTTFPREIQVMLRTFEELGISFGYVACCAQADEPEESEEGWGRGEEERETAERSELHGGSVLLPHLMLKAISDLQRRQRQQQQSSHRWEPAAFSACPLQDDSFTAILSTQVLVPNFNL